MLTVSSAILRCREAKCEPYICLNMGTGTLEEAIRWLEYCNGTGDTCVNLLPQSPFPCIEPLSFSDREYANLRRKNTGFDEPHNVKYWGLGNEIWGEWQVRDSSNRRSNSPLNFSFQYLGRPTNCIGIRPEMSSVGTCAQTCRSFHSTCLLR